jgi:hypothetical protein
MSSKGTKTQGEAEETAPIAEEEQAIGTPTEEQSVPEPTPEPLPEDAPKITPETPTVPIQEIKTAEQKFIAECQLLAKWRHKMSVGETNVDGKPIEKAIKELQLKLDKGA